MFRSTLTFLLPRAPLPWRTRFLEFASYCQQRRCRLMLREPQWVQTVTSHRIKVPIQCLQCKVTVTTTRIDAFYNGGHNIGCPCHKDPPWKYRYKEFRTLCRERGCRLMVTTEEEWVRSVRERRVYSKVPILCLECRVTVTTTSIHNFYHLEQLNCHCRMSPTQVSVTKYVQTVWPHGVLSEQTLRTSCGRHLRCDIVLLDWKGSGRGVP